MVKLVVCAYVDLQSLSAEYHCLWYTLPDEPWDLWDHECWDAANFEATQKAGSSGGCQPAAAAMPKVQSVWKSFSLSTCTFHCNSERLTENLRDGLNIKSARGSVMQGTLEAFTSLQIDSARMYLPYRDAWGTKIRAATVTQSIVTLIYLRPSRALPMRTVGLHGIRDSTTSAILPAKVSSDNAKELPKLVKPLMWMCLRSSHLITRFMPKSHASPMDYHEYVDLGNREDHYIVYVLSMIIAQPPRNPIFNATLQKMQICPFECSMHMCYCSYNYVQMRSRERRAAESLTSRVSPWNIWGAQFQFKYSVPPISNNATKFLHLLWIIHIPRHMSRREVRKKNA